MPPGERELVFCHKCENEWFRDEHGLTCSDPDCGSDIVEIIESSNDPRHQHDATSEFLPLHDHNPWNAPDPDEEDVSNVSFRSNTQSPGRGGSQIPPNPFDTLFSNFFSAMPPPGQNISSRNTSSFSSTNNVRGGGMTTWSVSYSSGPNGGFRSSRTTSISPNDDLAGIMDHFAQMMGGGHGPPGGAHPLVGILLGGPRAPGNIAYNQESFDRILTMLREQHGGHEGAPPASNEAIAALPIVKIAQEHMDEQGKAECSICMDQVNIGDEVTMLPCDHWFHGDCIKSWLTEHDTCPQCRRGITPRDGNQNQPRTTGQAPRNWQPDETDLQGILNGRSGSSSTDRGNVSRRSSSSRNHSSSGGSGLLGGVANIIRRATGGSSSSSNSNNRDRNEDSSRRNA